MRRVASFSPSERHEQSESISSMKITLGREDLATSKRFRTSRSDSPNHFDTRSDDEIEKNVDLASVATALPRKLLPVPKKIYYISVLASGCRQYIIWKEVWHLSHWPNNICPNEDFMYILKWVKCIEGRYLEVRIEGFPARVFACPWTAVGISQAIAQLPSEDPWQRRVPRHRPSARLVFPFINKIINKNSLLTNDRNF